MPKFLRWAAAFLPFLVVRLRNCHLNAGIKLLLKISLLRSFTVELCVWLLSRLVHHQLLYVFFYLFSV